MNGRVRQKRKGATVPDEIRHLRGLPRTRRPRRVLIVGAGLSGLCAAYELRRLGHDVVVLEAEREHVGGRVRTLDFGDGLYGEAGAMRLPKKHALTRHYVREFGLTLRRFVQSNPDAYAFVRGRRVRQRDLDGVRSAFALTKRERRSGIGKLWERSVGRIAARLSRRELDDLFAASPRTKRICKLDRRSLWDALVSAGLSPEAVQMLASGWGLESFLHTGLTVHLRAELDGTWLSGFDEIGGGFDTLAARFAYQLEGALRMRSEVVRIDQTAAGRIRAVYREPGSDKTAEVEGDWLICTVPLGTLQRIAIEPPLSAAKQQAVRRVFYQPATKVLARAERRFWEIDDAIYGGATVSDGPLGYTCYPSDNAHAKDPAVSRAPAVLLASYTWGQAARRMAAAGDVEALVVEELARFHHGLRRDPGQITRVVRWSWDRQPWSAGAFAYFRPGEHTMLHGALREPEGRLLLAGEHTSLDQAWIEGAIESALRVARHVAVH